jgi:hypothetical protein
MKQRPRLKTRLTREESTKELRELHERAIKKLNRPRRTKVKFTIWLEPGEGEWMKAQIKEWRAAGYNRNVPFDEAIHVYRCVSEGKPYGSSFPRSI